MPVMSICLHSLIVVYRRPWYTDPDPQPNTDW